MNLANAPVAVPWEERSQLGLAEALSRGDLAAAVDCFALDACLITPDMTAVHGREQIQPLLSQLIASGIAVQIEARSMVGGGGVVIVRERWRVGSAGAAERFVRTLHPTFVLRPVGKRWKLALAAPWGWPGSGG